MRHAVIVLIAVPSLSYLPPPQPAEELAGKTIPPKGGLEKIKAITSVRMSGELDGDEFKAVESQESKRPNWVRKNMSLQGMTAVEAYDGSNGWQVQPFGGHKDPELMGEDDLRDLLLDADFDGPLVDYTAKGNTVEYLGHDEVDGDDALRLKVTLKNGDIIYYFLDPETNLEIRKEVQQFIRGSIRETVVELGSYKPVEGVMFPFSISQRPKNSPRAQTTTFEKIEVNVVIPDSDFSLPMSLKAAK